MGGYNRFSSSLDSFDLVNETCSHFNFLSFQAGEIKGTHNKGKAPAFNEKTEQGKSVSEKFMIRKSV